MTMENRDLLEFLVNVSHQLEGLLNYNIDQQEVTDSDVDHFYLNTKVFQHHLTSNPENSNECCTSQIPQLEYQQSSWEYYNNHTEFQTITAPVSVNQVGYATHYVPSASTNFVESTQYSAKPSQRQDTGYVYRDELSLPPDHAMPAQEYQPECAYCCWLATTTINSQVSDLQ